MEKKRIYEKPSVIEMLDNSIVYGQDSTMGMCGDGSAPAGSTYGCGVGNAVVPFCGVGIAAESSTCDHGSTPYFGDVCAAGGTHTAECETGASA